MTLVGERTWPREVELMISAMEAAHRWPRERRKRYRTPHRTVATLRLFVEGDGRARTIYIRNVDPRGAGFLSPQRLPLGYGGTVEMHTPAGDSVIANCTIFRCSEIVNGWYEAALSFNTEQLRFDVPPGTPALKLHRPP